MTDAYHISRLDCDMLVHGATRGGYRRCEIFIIPEIQRMACGDNTHIDMMII